MASPPNCQFSIRNTYFHSANTFCRFAQFWRNLGGKVLRRQSHVCATYHFFIFRLSQNVRKLLFRTVHYNYVPASARGCGHVLVRPVWHRLKWHHRPEPKNSATGSCLLLLPQPEREHNKQMTAQWHNETNCNRRDIHCNIVPHAASDH